MVIKIDTTKKYGIDTEKVVEGDFLGQSQRKKKEIKGS